MDNTYADILRRLAKPLEPIPTGEPARLGPMPGVRAVLFDVYGTLFVSDSGDVGTARDEACRHAVDDGLRAMGVRTDGAGGDGARWFLGSIRDAHARSRSQGIAHPEVDIVEIWREVVEKLSAAGRLDGEGWTDARLRRLAVEYEGRVNPVWPMPHVRECLEGLRRKGIVLGIISNAQFYTPLLFPALLGGPAESLGMEPDLQFYSYRIGHAKPGLTLHQMAAETLSRRGIGPAETLYVGNDMLNDVLPAARLGFRTALFAGDARSLRLRRDEPRVGDLAADLVLTRLADLNASV